MGQKAIFNPFSGNLIMVPIQSVASIPYELYQTDDSEFSSAVMEAEHNQLVAKFSKGAQHTLRGRFKVPNDYNLGLLRLSFTCYSPSITNGFQFDLRSFLYLPDTGVVGSEALYNDYDSGLISNVGVSETLRKLYIYISDGNSKIGSTTITAGSLIDFRLQRRTLSSGDDTADIRVIPNLEIIKA